MATGADSARTGARCSDAVSVLWSLAAGSTVLVREGTRIQRGSACLARPRRSMAMAILRSGGLARPHIALRCAVRLRRIA